MWESIGRALGPLGVVLARWQHSSQHHIASPACVRRLPAGDLELLVAATTAAPGASVVFGTGTASTLGRQPNPEPLDEPATPTAALFLPLGSSSSLQSIICFLSASHVSEVYGLLPPLPSTSGSSPFHIFVCLSFFLLFFCFCPSCLQTQTPIRIQTRSELALLFSQCFYLRCTYSLPFRSPDSSVLDSEFLFDVCVRARGAMLCVSLLLASTRVCNSSCSRSSANFTPCPCRIFFGSPVHSFFCFSRLDLCFPPHFSA